MGDAIQLREGFVLGYLLEAHDEGGWGRGRQGCAEI